MGPEWTGNDLVVMGSAASERPAEPTASVDSSSAQSHDFEVQRQVHQQIRNDPDYDDWEYGTEPLPHEAWVQGKGEQRQA